MTDNKFPSQTDLDIDATKPLFNAWPVLHKGYDNRSDTVVNMSRYAFDKMMSEICPKPAERGGICLGQGENNDITDFYFDTGGTVTGDTYAPDYVTLAKKLKEEWIPAGIDFKGIAHSHPGRFDRLTPEDLAYIRRLLIINPKMSMFVAPIIIPHEFRMRMMVVFRDNPAVAVDAQINFF